MKNFKTVKIFTKTADKLKAHCKKHGLIMAAFISLAIEEKLKAEKK